MKQENEILPQAIDKSFILVIPNDFGIYELFNLNLKAFGFKLISVVPKLFRYQKKSDRVKNFFHKSFIGGRSYKQKLINKFHSENIESKIGHLAPASIDYILIIRPDIVNTETLDKLFTIGKNVIAYQWDGLDRFPDVFNCISRFEKFLIFDTEDFKKYKNSYSNLQLCENFYFDIDCSTELNSTSNIVYYIGAYYPDRMKELNAILSKLQSFSLDFNVRLRDHSSSRLNAVEHVVFFKDYIDFKTNLQWVKDAKILLDFKVPEHSGLSLRFFEALKYRKKIITNNASVLKYEFYHPQNIFVLDYDNEERLGEFVSSDYYEIDPDVVNYYSFSSWLQRNVL